jgi:hypothetical protein
MGSVELVLVGKARTLIDRFAFFSMHLLLLPQMIGEDLASTVSRNTTKR